MNFLKTIWRFLVSVYLSQRWFIALSAIVVVFALGHFFPFLFVIGQVALLALCVLTFIDGAILYAINGIQATRDVADRLSNGDDNPVKIHVVSSYPFAIDIRIVDEVPHQFQIRDFVIRTRFEGRQNKAFVYHLRPTERGEYSFGTVNVYVSAWLGLISRRYRFEQPSMVPVYPSYIQMRRYEIMAISNRLVDAGIKKIRRVSNNNEFDQIRQYVRGDDYRTLNWKATARKSQLMVNQYQDEKSQQVYSIIDMGRAMKMPFEGMTLLDYAINTSLVISNIAMYKQDKAGLITFNNKVNTVIRADRKKSHMMTILEALYKQQTTFKESNMELVYGSVRRHVKQRSLLLIYTNFEALSSMQRQLKYFRRLADSHLVVVIFFENTEINKVINESTNDTEGVYIKTIAEKFSYEKKQIVKELQRNGVHAILSEPQHLSVNTINKYLELKARGLI